jgi:hypothetical protein
MTLADDMRTLRDNAEETRRQLQQDQIDAAKARRLEAEKCVKDSIPYAHDSALNQIKRQATEGHSKMSISLYNDWQGHLEAQMLAPLLIADGFNVEIKTRDRDARWDDIAPTRTGYTEHWLEVSL